MGAAPFKALAVVILLIRDVAATADDSHLAVHFLTDFSAKGRLQVAEVLQTRPKAAVHDSQTVRIEWIATSGVVLAVALVTYYRFTAIESGRQDEEDEADDRRGLVRDHGRDRDRRIPCARGSCSAWA